MGWAVWWPRQYEVGARQGKLHDKIFASRMIDYEVQGSVINEETNIQLGFWRNIVAERTQPLTIYSSPRDTPPNLFRYGGCSKLATFKLDFTGVDLSQFEKRVIQGETIHRAEIQYRVHFGDRQGLLKFSASIGGVELGNTSVSFEGEEAIDSTGPPMGDESWLPTCSVQ